jgi:hypothetical protein
VQIGAAEHSRLEAPHESGHVEGRIDGHAVEEDELEVGRAPPHEEHIGRVRRVIARQGGHGVQESGLPDARTEFERLELELR